MKQQMDIRFCEFVAAERLQASVDLLLTAKAGILTIDRPHASRVVSVTRHLTSCKYPVNLHHFPLIQLHVTCFPILDDAVDGCGSWDGDDCRHPFFFDRLMIQARLAGLWCISSFGQSLKSLDKLHVVVKILWLEAG